MLNLTWNAVSGDAEILNKPTTLSGYGITNAYTKTETDIMMTAVSINIKASLQHLQIYLQLVW